MTTPTEIWGEKRVRMYFEQGRENPWSRSGDVARDHREFRVRINLTAMYEELEDFEVLAPPYPVWSHTSWDWSEDHSVYSMPEEFPSPEVFVRGAYGDRPLTEQDRAALGFAGGKPPADSHSFELALEVAQGDGELSEVRRAQWRAKKRRSVSYATLAQDNVDLLMEFDRDLVEIGPHRYVTNQWGDRLAPTSYTQPMLCTDGRRHSLSAVRLAWLLEHGEITRSTFLNRTCRDKRCVSAHHHRKKG